VADKERTLDEQLIIVRERAVEELAEIRSKDQCTLTPRLLVRKAMLLQFEDAPDGTPQEIEEALKSALKLDDRYIEAHIELGRYYYAVLGDAERARTSFLTALRLLGDISKEAIQGLLDCDAELHPESGGALRGTDPDCESTRETKSTASATKSSRRSMKSHGSPPDVSD
jgi:tetratricopeptide (TPR) repeat protein